MKQVIAIVLVLVCVLTMAGCAILSEDPITPTGFPDGEIQQPQIMYNGIIYFYYATGFNEPLPYGFEYVGSLSAIDNQNEPAEDFCGARVELGQEVYASATNADTVYLKYDQGYAQFSIGK